MSKHTPGPWSIFTDDKHKHNAGIEAENFSIVTIGYFDETPGIDDSGVKGNTEEEALANAHLIAAAPDLLEALELYALSYSDEELVQLAECTSGMGEISPVTAKREIIRRVAIAKAKGKQL